MSIDPEGYAGLEFEHVSVLACGGVDMCLGRLKLGFSGTWIYAVALTEHDLTHGPRAFGDTAATAVITLLNRMR